MIKAPNEPTFLEAPSDVIFREHLAGKSLRALGKRHGCSHEAIRCHIISAKSKFLSETEMALYLAAKLEATPGREAEASWPTLLIPNGDQEDDTVARKRAEIMPILAETPWKMPLSGSLPWKCSTS